MVSKDTYFKNRSVTVFIVISPSFWVFHRNTVIPRYIFRKRPHRDTGSYFQGIDLNTGIGQSPLPLMHLLHILQRTGHRNHPASTGIVPRKSDDPVGLPLLYQLKNTGLHNRHPKSANYCGQTFHVPPNKPRAAGTSGFWDYPCRSYRHPGPLQQVHRFPFEFSLPVVRSPMQPSHWLPDTHLPTALNTDCLPDCFCPLPAETAKTS